MGSVYLATEVALGRFVAVKVLARDLADSESFRLRFEREARAAAGISHPNVVQVYTVGEAAGDPPLPFIIMQYVDGTALDAVLRERGRLGERLARRVLRDVAAALDAAHQRDLVHRDVKPANILIERDSGRAFVVDFGISAALSRRAIGGAEPLDETGIVMGTAAYMSPEQRAGLAVGSESDLYSLGVTAYELLVGSLPPKRDLAAPPLESILNRRKGVSEDLARLVERCLADQPGARPSAPDLARELLPSPEHEILWPPPGLLPLLRLGRHVRQAATVLIASAAILVISLAFGVPGISTAAGWWAAWAGGAVVAADSAAPGPWIVVLWQTIMIGSAVAVTAALCAFILVAGRTAVMVSSSRSRGWRSDTIRDVLADPDGRTGLLVSGSIDFATVSVDTRARIRRLRRVAQESIAIAAGYVALLFVAWGVSVLIGAPLQEAGGPPAAAIALVLLAAAPAIALTALAAAGLLAERRLTRPASWRRPHSGAYAVPSDSGEEDVIAWYAELPGDRGADPARDPPNRLPVAVARMIVAVLTGWSTLSLAMLLVATFYSSRLARRIGSDTSRLASLVAGPGLAASLTEVRDALRRYVAPAANDGGPTASLARLLPPDSSAIGAYPVEPRIALGARQGAFASTTLLADAVRRATTLPADTLRLLASLADHPRTRLFRDVARRPAIDIPVEVGASAVRACMEANGAGAVVAAARGDFTAAAVRLGENAAMSEAALAAPNESWPLAGLRLLQSLVVLPLAEVESLRGNAAGEQTLRHAASSLSETIDRLGPSLVLGAVGIAGDPRDLHLLERLGADTTIPPGLRTAAIEASGDGVCLNTREWLMGADAARTAVLGTSPIVPSPFRAHGPRGILDRIRYCAALATP